MAADGRRGGKRAGGRPPAGGSRPARRDGPPRKDGPPRREGGPRRPGPAPRLKGEAAPLVRLGPGARPSPTLTARPAPPHPARVKAPPLPSHAQAPTEGRWLWTCRDAFEPFLYEELAWAGASPRLLGAGLVESGAVKELPAFARMGFPVAARLGPAPDARTVAQAVATLQRLRRGRRVCPQAWTADTLAGNALSASAAALEAAVLAALPPEGRLEDAWQARAEGALLGQLCVVSPEAVAVGVVPATEALSLSPGGRRRMRRPGQAPSRAAMKLEEALDALGVEPGKGELCVDLGAAPGGWTERLLARGARVVAVDPARLMPSLQGNRRLTHVQESAFDYAPEEPADWLFCDMAWRPLEVAQLLAKWGRRGWAHALVANIKLPMKDKLPILHRVRHVLTEEGGWKALTVRQLYHDRDEVTVTARAR